jgi:hypothetical protein
MRKGKQKADGSPAWPESFLQNISHHKTFFRHSGRAYLLYMMPSSYSPSILSDISYASILKHAAM